MKKIQIEKKIRELEDRYCDLVWYARRGYLDPKVPAQDEEIERIRRQMFVEVLKLRGPHSRYHHGFNSGCLAILRLVSGLLGDATDAKLALEEFPCLDT